MSSGTATRTHRPAGIQPLVWGAVAAAWLLSVAAQLGGLGPLMHHDALIESGPPIAVATAAFTAAWVVMVAAMMLPSSAGAIAAFGSGVALGERSRLDQALFIGAYFCVWACIGLARFLADMVLHRVVDVTPWLSERPWLVEAGVVALAGAYQFTGSKRASLEACRHPRIAGHGGASGVRAGIAHTVDCLGSSGPLMLLMFAAGFANLWWMAALTVLMAYETWGRHGLGAARLAGGALLYLAVVILTTQGL